MTESMVKRVRQICVSVLALCLALFAVSFVQNKTGESKQANAGMSEAEREPVNQFLTVEGITFTGSGHAGVAVEQSGWAKIFGTEIPEIARKQGEYCVLIEKSGGSFIEATEEMVWRRLRIKTEGVDLSENSVYRICGKQLYQGMPVVELPPVSEKLKNVPLEREPKRADEDVLVALTVEEKDNVQEIVLEFNTVYEVTVTEDEEFIYLGLVRPHEKYEKIVVLDAGHGGIDPGTSGGGATEASVNLDVIRYAKEILDTRDDIKVYYTRLNNTLPDLSTRVEFANALHADLLISVHCNYNSVAALNGVEVLYSKLQEEGIITSKALAGICLEEVSEATGLKKNSLVERSSNLHIMKYCKVPSALIEFGYMSSRKDLKIILTEKGKKACAEAICRAVDSIYYGLRENNEEKGEEDV